MHTLSIKSSFFDHASHIHGRLHTLRVMYWTKLLSDYVQETADAHPWQGLTADEKTRAGNLAFCAAVIHDCARQHDGKCTDHGLYAAQTKRWIVEQELYQGAVPEEDWSIIERALILHCRDEGELGCSVADLALALLKDADAIDRVRLHYSGPNPEYLRFPVSAGLIAQARTLLQWTHAKDRVDWSDLLERERIGRGV